MLTRSTALLLMLALTACSGAGAGGGSALPRLQTAQIRHAADGVTADYGGGANALPGGGANALPGGGALALPGGGYLALPGGGANALPGGGAIALPGLGSPLGTPVVNNVTGLLAALLKVVPLCAVASLVVHQAQCNALLSTKYPVNPDPNALPSAIAGLHPRDLQSTYHLPSSGGAGHTIAIVDAGDDPTAESDLAVYRSAFGLAPCTSANGCFHKVNQYGSSNSLPPTMSGWSQEIGIDVDMVSAICASCSILLIEVNSADLSDLGAGVDTAAALGAGAVSNSYYAPEYDSELADEVHFNHPGIAITVSSGDTGYGTTFPAASRYVTAVGGTTLAQDLFGSSESVWRGSGSGCSAYVAKPSWQHDGGCSNRTVTDVAVVADPDTGVSVYNTTAPAGQSGWGVYGGTSVGAPIVAAIYALAGDAGSVQGASYPYGHAGAFKQIITGSNGWCTPMYLCNGGFGYNGPTGLGSPNGISGF